ncbi:hypothetical protein NEOKW01_1296 [Nematocida sp. AWRm80]|nr:hypothetical protein NEOKW01_1296 [Nematocida sp. AWRm80]
MFNAETHFISKVKNNLDGPTDDLRVWLGNTTYSKLTTKRVKEPKLPYKNLSPTAIEQLNVIFTTYFRQLRQEHNKASMLSIIYNLELMGVEISPIPHTDSDISLNTLPKGILVNETLNTMAIAMNGIVKIYPKKMYNYLIYIENSTYFIIGSALKLDRRYNK